LYEEERGSDRIIALVQYMSRNSCDFTSGLLAMMFQTSWCIIFIRFLSLNNMNQFEQKCGDADLIMIEVEAFRNGVIRSSN
jgi:hypothetical protein